MWGFLEAPSLIGGSGGTGIALSLFVLIFIAGCLVVSYWVFRILYLRFHPVLVLIIALLVGIPAGIANCFVGVLWVFYFYPPVVG